MKKILIVSGIILGLANPVFAEKKVKSSTTTTEQNSSNQQSATAPTATTTTTTNADGTANYGAASDTTTQTTVAPTAPASDSASMQESKTTTSQYSESDEKPRISKGGFYIEPMISAIREDSTLNSAAIGGNTSGTTEGYGVGLRLGGHVSEVLFLGVDGRYAKMKQSDSFYDNNSANIYNVAPMIGLQTPLWGVRILAGYVLLGENSPDANRQGVKLKFTEPRGWRVGAGLHAGPVGINLEYQDLKYNKADVQALGSVASNVNITGIDESTKGYSLSLSFPVEM